MQVKETVADGLKREFQVTLAVSDIGSQVDARLDELKDKVRLNGFRPGKVPLSHLKRTYGRSVTAEVVEKLIRDTNDKIFTDRGFRLATEPKITMPTEAKEVEDVLSGNADLNYTVAVEVVPEIQLVDFKSITVEKPVVEVSDSRRRRRHQAHRRSQSRLCRQGRGRQGRQRRPRDGVVQGHDRRHAVRRRQRRGHPGGDRLGHLHPGLRGPVDRHRRRRDPQRQGDLPDQLRHRRIWPARRRSSRPPRRWSRRRRTPRPTTNSPRRSAWNRSTS